MANSGKAPKAPLCFVIGPIGREGTPERRHADLLLHAVIKQVLEAEEFGYKVKRADEDADPGMIGDRVISDITHAELVVADLTDLNPNAFYELGIRHSIEKPTVHVARSDTQLPFDNVSHRTILIDLTDWQSIVRGREQLAASARAIKEPDYQVSNPITQANASFKMRQSADPRDRIISELQERLAGLEMRWAYAQNRVTDLTGDLGPSAAMNAFNVNDLTIPLSLGGGKTNVLNRLLYPYPMRPPSPAPLPASNQGTTRAKKPPEPNRSREQSGDEENEH
jgi:hypothetical protein